MHSWFCRITGKYGVTMKTIPNFISCSRIILSLILLFTKPLGQAFYVVYIICGLSDVLDGFIARKTAASSKLGEKLDSVADLMMVGVMFIIFYPVIYLPTGILIWIISIAVLRFFSLAVALIKYKTFVILHSYANKFTGMLLFIAPLLLPYFEVNTLMYIICSAASISSVEELIIHLTSTQLRVNRPCIFIK